MDTQCKECGIEYSRESRKGKAGLVTVCNDCAIEPIERYTGVMIYGHKTAGAIQINSDPGLTKYMLNATKLKAKASNLGNNLMHSYKTKTEGACKYVPDSVTNYKGR